MSPDPRDTRPAQAGETDTTRAGMEDGDNTDVPATGPASRPPSRSDHDEAAGEGAAAPA